MKQQRPPRQASLPPLHRRGITAKTQHKNRKTKKDKRKKYERKK
jgi:hypothetical protein